MFCYGDDLTELVTTLTMKTGGDSRNEASKMQSPIFKEKTKKRKLSAGKVHKAPSWKSISSKHTANIPKLKRRTDSNDHVLENTKISAKKELSLDEFLRDQKPPIPTTRKTKDNSVYIPETPTK